MDKETFKDHKGTFHYEPVVWGDWKEGDEVIFEGFTNTVHNHWSFNIGCTYPVGKFDEIVGPISFKGQTPTRDWGFKFSRKVYDVVESLDNLLKELHNLKQEEKELSAKVDNILKEINSVVGLYGLSILFTNEYDMLQEND